MQSNSNTQPKPTAPQQNNTGLAPTSLFGASQTNVQQPSLFQFPQQINQTQNVSTGFSFFGQYPPPQMNISNSYVPQVQPTFQQLPVQQSSSSFPQQFSYPTPPPQQTMPSYTSPIFFGSYGNASLRSQAESLKTISFADD